MCKCNEPGNPDKVLVGCSAVDCKKWLHEECLRHETLMRVWGRLGPDKPHRAFDVKEEKENEVTRPLSPVEPGTGAVAAALPIQVKTDGEGEAVKAGDTVAVKEELAAGAQGSAKTHKGRPSATQTPTRETPSRKGGRGRKKADNVLNHKPYAGLFEATFVPESGTFEVTDLRTGIQGGEEKWNENAFCLVCGTEIA